VKVLKPPVASLSHLKIEHSGIDKLLDIDLAVGSLDYLGAVIELLDQVENAFFCALIDLSFGATLAELNLRA
jgi:hypothetical protein